MADLTHRGQPWGGGIPRESWCLAILAPGLLGASITACPARHYDPSRAAQESLDEDRLLRSRLQRASIGPPPVGPGAPRRDAVRRPAGVEFARWQGVLVRIRFGQRDTVDPVSRLSRGGRRGAPVRRRLFRQDRDHLRAERGGIAHRRTSRFGPASAQVSPSWITRDRRPDHKAGRVPLMDRQGHTHTQWPMNPVIFYAPNLAANPI
jgi:hypothetical protein